MASSQNHHYRSYHHHLYTICYALASIIIITIIVNLIFISHLCSVCGPTITTIEIITINITQLLVLVAIKLLHIYKIITYL